MSSFDDLAERLHKLYRGKLSVIPKVPIQSHEEFAIWYTPGVASPCREIAKDPERVHEYTIKGNTVGVVSDGSRVLGLGDIGPEASLPVMEGKALLLKFLADIDAFPICLKASKPSEIIDTVVRLSPTFGGICLEDIDAPKCFEVLEALSHQLEIPIIHDDQHGTAVVVLAALKNALKIVGKRLSEIRTVHLGAGAAGLAVARLLIASGADPSKMILLDSKGILYSGRPEMDKWKRMLAEVTNKEGRTGGLKEAMKGADVVIGLSKPGPGVITKEMIESMAEDPIVFALANPYPEISPNEALKAGARIVATGRSDYPNQVNNALATPAVFRALLDVRAKGTNDEIFLSAAEVIAQYAEEKGLREDFIVPNIGDQELYAREASALVSVAVNTGIARLRVSPEEEYETVSSRLKRLREILRVMIEVGAIPYAPMLQESEEGT
ncbi:MAG: NADP-dependent malic enzyme [Candidatus Bathyarchaeia archaeon]